MGLHAAGLGFDSQEPSPGKPAQRHEHYQQNSTRFEKQTIFHKINVDRIVLMSARPRLVQEGRPLSEQSDEYHNDMMRYNHASSLSTATSDVVNRRPSKHRSKQCMRLVIGGEDDDEIMKETGEEQSHYIRANTNTNTNSAGSQATLTRTRLVIGGDEPPLERMEGVESHDAKGPLVVIDGANVAYAYADAISMERSGGRHPKGEPDAKGIQIAANYFLSVGVRVTIVLPAPWIRAKPRSSDQGGDNSLMVTDQLELLQDLKAKGLLVPSPPRDDDDAYALTIARREDVRAKQRGEGGGFVLSNDMFRDAIGRDERLGNWLKQENGRISYAFVDMANLDDFGDRLLDFIPYPRHPLVNWAEEMHRTNHVSR